MIEHGADETERSIVTALDLDRQPIFVAGGDRLPPDQLARVVLDALGRRVEGPTARLAEGATADLERPVPV